MSSQTWERYWHLVSEGASLTLVTVWILCGSLCCQWQSQKCVVPFVLTND